MKKTMQIFFFAAIFFSQAICSLYADELNMRFDSDTGIFNIPLGKSYDYANIRVKRAIDGDTIQLENGERVRLIGIDTPEMHDSDKLRRDALRAKEDTSAIQKLGREAYAFTKELVEGKMVSLEFDVEKYDKYDRLLAYVYLKDGTFVNAEIVKAGYASLLTIPPNIKYADLLVQLYRQARQEKKGLWK